MLELATIIKFVFEYFNLLCSHYHDYSKGHSASYSKQTTVQYKTSNSHSILWTHSCMHALLVVYEIFIKHRLCKRRESMM